MTDKEKIIAYIDKLLEKYPKNYYLLTVAEFINSLQEEHISEDLEKAYEQFTEKARMYKAETISPFFSPTDYKQGVIDGVKWQKQQMMAKAIDAEVKVDAGGYPYIDKTIELYDYDKDVPLAKEGDKYKVVLIKED